MQANYKEILPGELPGLMQRSAAAFQVYGCAPFEKRALFMKMLAAELEAVKDELLSQAHLETHWEKDWLAQKLGRTCDLLKGEVPDNTLPNKGVVVAFCAAPFPFSTSLGHGQVKALAAGCTLVNLEHPRHAKTSELVASAVEAAAVRSHFLPGLIISVNSKEAEVAEALVSHPAMAALYFDGPVDATWMTRWEGRLPPLTFFEAAEKSAAVFLLPGVLEKGEKEFAAACAAIIAAGGGQSFARPGILVAVQGKSLDKFIEALGFQIAQVPPATMLHPGLARQYQHRRADLLALKEVNVVGTLSCPVGREESIPTLAKVDGSRFMEEPLLQTEVFGPFSLLVQCRDEELLLQVAEVLQPRTVCSLFAPSGEDIVKELTTVLERKCKTILFSEWPAEGQMKTF